MFLVFDMKVFCRCFGCMLIEGYGMTETSCIITLMDVGDVLAGHVGSPHAACGEYPWFLSGENF